MAPRDFEAFFGTEMQCYQKGVLHQCSYLFEEQGTSECSELTQTHLEPMSCGIVQNLHRSPVRQKITGRELILGSMVFFSGSRKLVFSYLVAIASISIDIHPSSQVFNI